MDPRGAQHRNSRVARCDHPDRARLWGILNAIRLKVSNARAEALNSQIRAMRVKARGYRDKTRFMTGILFHYGGLDMGH
ncbi:hypothetical protein MyNCGM683_07930 [Achromobacter xylosoxidans]